MRHDRKIRIIAAALAVSMGLGSFLAWAQASPKPTPPVYKVDPFWPKPLPNKWIMQGVPDLVVDKDDHIWVINRPRDIMPDESGAATRPAPHRLLHRGTGGIGIRHRRKSDQGLGRPGLRAGLAGSRNRTSGPRRRTRHRRGSGRKRLAFGKRPRRQHPKVHRRWQAPLGFWPSRTAGRRRGRSGTFEAKQSGNRCLPRRNFLLRPG